MSPQKRQHSRDSDDGYDREMRNRENSPCCSCTKFLIFILFLGAAVGAIFGFIDIEQIENFFTGGNSSSSTGSGGEDSGGGGTDEPAFSFMQCPETGACCNGLPSNCDLKVNELMFATAHNANHDNILVPNHEAPLEGALEAGYRGLMLDVCKCENAETNTFEITFCHSICGVGPRDPSEVFENINSFLNDNPNEVIVINFEMSAGDPTPFEIWEVMKTNGGLRQKSYNHESGAAWPTMGEFLADGKQLLVFEHNYSENCFDPTNTGCTKRIEPWFTYVVETPYEFSNVDEVENYEASCAENRGVLGQKDFYSVNHFVTAIFGPSKSAANDLNMIESINNRISACERITEHEVNMFAVDFWQRGGLPEVTQTVNKERAKKKRKTRGRFLSWFRG